MALDNKIKQLKTGMNQTNLSTTYKMPRDLLNKTSIEFKNSNYTGAEELANTPYLDNFEHVEHELEEKGSPSFMEDLEHMMREELRDLIQDKVDQTNLDMHINATDAKLVEAINLLKGTE